MNLILYLSEAVIPILVLLIVGNGLMHRQHVYEDFLEGAKSGIRTAVEIMPTLIGLMAAVGILRASGFLDFISGWLGKLMAATGFPTELIPVAVVKMFSSSAATGLLLDIYKTHGADSMLGRAASVMLSSTETIFYTMSVYFMSVKVKRQDIHFREPFLQPLPELWQVYFLCGKPKVVRIVLLFAWQPVCSSKIVKNIRIMIEIC